MELLLQIKSKNNLVNLLSVCNGVVSDVTDNKYHKVQLPEYVVENILQKKYTFAQWYKTVVWSNDDY